MSIPLSSLPSLIEDVDINGQSGSESETDVSSAYSGADNNNEESTNENLSDLLLIVVAMDLQISIWHHSSCKDCPSHGGHIDSNA